MKDLWNYLKGKKTYVGLALAAIVLVANKFGVPLPEGLHVNPDQIDRDLYQVVIAAAMRHGIG